MYEIIIQSIVQGITEFLPVSSSAHLILFTEIFLVKKNNIILYISLHVGSFLAIIFYFTKDLNNFLKNKELLIKVLISSIPTGLFGIILIKLELLEHLRNLYVISFTTIFFALIMFISDFNNYKNTIKKNFSYKSACILGVFQILSLIPGTSRSGIILTTARFLKFHKIEAAKLSFLTSLPILFYALTYNLFKILEQNSLASYSVNTLGIFFSFIFSYITIKFFLKFLQNFNLTFFVLYRIILGLIILLCIK